MHIRARAEQRIAQGTVQILAELRDRSDPGIFKLLFEHVEIPPVEAFYIDDNPRNVAASNPLGMRAVQFVDRPTLRRDLVAHGLLDG